jgi:aldose 1-epimerase
MKPTITLGLLTFVLAAGTLHADPNSQMKQEIYGKMPDGSEVKIFTLTNKNGLKARVTEYGAILVSMETPDKSGKSADITHGYDTLDGWLTNTSYFGATVGRFGNRIAHGKFTLDGKEYTLATNNDPGGIPCHLHGGVKGFDKVLWSGKPTDSNAVEFTYLSKDGEEGYPGNLTVKVTYSLNDDNELKWEARATTDAPTILNVVHHSYWNLSGDPTTSINDHLLTLNAPSYLPTDIGLIPTGEIAPVAGTPMDFTKPTAIGERLGANFEALKFGGGYDHAWVLEQGDGLRLAARLKDPNPAASWKSPPTNPPSSSTAATSSMAQSPARAASSMPTAPPSASKPRTSRTPLTSPTSHPPSYARVKPTST